MTKLRSEKMNKEAEVKNVECEKDSVSRKSSESSTSSSDYVVVGDNKSLTSPVLGYVVSENDLEDAIAANSVNMINSPSTPNVVGKSIFYDCLNDPSPSNENLSFQKSDTDEGIHSIFQYLHALIEIPQFIPDAATYEIDQEYKNDGNFTIFSNVLYLGSANISVPKSEAEIQRHINELNTSSGNAGVKVKISIPNCCDGQVVLVLSQDRSKLIIYSVNNSYVSFYL